MTRDWPTLALKLQREIGLIDLHVDSLIQTRLFGYDITQRHRAWINGQPLFGHADIPRMIEAGYGGALMGIHYFPWESPKGWKELLKQIEVLDNIALKDPRVLRVLRHEDWDRAKKEGKIALMPGIEGAHMLDAKLDRVPILAEKQVAYMTLVHFAPNSAATPGLGWGGNEKQGLTDFGKALVKTLNHFGIAVDVAHANMPCLLDACRITQKPLLCSHTALKGIYDFSRNISDEAIKAIANVDGTIGIIFSPHYLGGDRKLSSTAVVDHIDYLKKKIGIRHISIGSDYDGWLPAIPSDQRDCLGTVQVTAELLRRGYRDTEIEAILRTNVLRVLKAQK